MKTNWIRILVALLVVGVLAATGGWYWYTNVNGYVETDDAIVDGYQSTVSSKVLGRIAALLVNESETVKAGQLLVQLDDADLQAQQAQDQASLGSSDQDIALAQVNLAKAQNDFQRVDSQYQGEFISKQEFDNARTALEVAKVNYSRSLAAHKTVQSKLGVDATNLRNTRIVSPIDGIVAKRWALTGDVVQAGQSIFSIYDLKNVWITANFEETKLAALHTGQPVAITVDAYPGKRFAGKVQEIGTNTAAQFSLIPPNNASGNFTKVTQRVPIKIRIEPVDKGHQLLPGMSVEVKVKVN